MEASRLRTLMKKSRLLPLALCFLSLFLILGVQGYAQNCTAFAGPGNVPLETGVGASLNGFLPFGGSVPTLYGPAAWNYQVYNATTQTYAPGFSVDPNSAAIIAQINHGDKIGGKPAPLHPDFGPAGGMPYTVVDSSSQPAINLYGLKAGPDSPESAASQTVCHQPAGASALPMLESCQTTETGWPALAVAGALTPLTTRSGLGVRTVSNTPALEMGPAALVIRTL